MILSSKYFFLHSFVLECVCVCVGLGLKDDEMVIMFVHTTSKTFVLERK